MEAVRYFQITNDSTDKTIEQGDIFLNVPLFDAFPISDPDDPSITRIASDKTEKSIIVLTQTCDLVNGKMPKRILVAELTDFSTVNKEAPHLLKDKAIIRELDQNTHPRFAVLHPFVNDENITIFDWHLADFRSLGAVHYLFFDSTLYQNKVHLRMLSPYREHYSQIFARNIMRVALPLEEETLKNYLNKKVPIQPKSSPEPHV